jgi:hypothetical protein
MDFDIQLFPWHRVFLSHLGKKFLAFMKPGSSLLCSQNPPLNPILSRLNPVHISASCFSKIHYNIIFPPIPQFSKFFPLEIL